MPVAVRLLEVLAILTLMILITCVSICVVMAQYTISLTVSFLEPAANILYMVLFVAQKLIVGSLVCALSIINVIVSGLHAIGLG